LSELLLKNILTQIGGGKIQLKNNNEIIGQLNSIEKIDNKLKLKFTIHKEIELSLDSISVDILVKLKGKLAGIINVDGQFFVREI